MLNPTELMKQTCVNQLQDKYVQVLGQQADGLAPNPAFEPDYAVLLGLFATQVLDRLSTCTALYHNVEHTVLVCLVGQEILQGKHQREGNVTCEDWLNVMVSLLCHDIGYVGGICQQDQVAQRRYIQGLNFPGSDSPKAQGGVGTLARGNDGARGTGDPSDHWVTLAPGATDASLSPYHVARSQLFVQENLSCYGVLDLEAIQHNIGFTQFPVPQDPAYQVTDHYPGLVRAADLIGQLSDPTYLQKTVALFYEFEEVGTNQLLGYGSPQDLKLGYPRFYHNQVYPYLEPALSYLQATTQGRRIIANLEANVATVERELQGDQSQEHNAWSTSTLNPRSQALNPLGARLR